MLSLRKNKLIGTLPRAWDTPALQYLLLQDNQLTGELWGKGQVTKGCQQGPAPCAVAGAGARYQGHAPA